ncbi:SusC/RagA family TonB-linked outer membrane protein [Niabella aurantiaca]|uniref:SusC/RagA family TonB-linked outer membrane protein n=1 Tax=Niabella aurantiaca TaxID=379900 RepID=UPI0003A9295C|nr:TonB-dependent receptor [Niabella aurantiaca]
MLKQLLTAVRKSRHLVYQVCTVFMILISLQGYGSEAHWLWAPVKGVVNDEAGNPVKGTSVVVKGTSRGTTTGDDGSFQIEASANDVLVFTHSGFLQKELKVTITASRLAVVLQARAGDMEEIVVIGYGTMKRKDLTGSVSSIKGDEIRKATTATLQDALQGRLAGVQVITTGGAPGGGMQIKIRGGSTLTAGNQPLYVIDGFPLTPSLNPDYNPLSDINPSDVASVEVLKDASATAIYGAEGANGVILVTTKKGRSNSKPVVEAGAYYGISKPLAPIRVLNAGEYKDYKIEVLTQTPEQRDAVASWQAKDPATAHVWMDDILQQGRIYNTDIGVRGGGNNGTTYSTNMSYYNENGIIKKSNYERITAKVALDQQLGKKLRIGVKMFYSNIGMDGFLQEYTNANSLFKQALMMSPYSLGIPTDIVTDFTSDNEQNNFDNNLSDLIHKAIRTRKLERIQPGVNFQYRILKDLMFNFMYGQDRLRTDYNTFYPGTTRQGYPLGEAERNMSTTVNWYQNTRLNYNRVFHKAHRLDLTAVYETKSTSDEDYQQQASGFATDILGLNNFELASVLLKPEIARTKQNMISYVGRANYVYNDKYMVSLTYRRDGSSKFGTNNRWANFPAAGLAWRLSEEPFMKKQRIFSNLKIRYGWGITGNSQIPPYSSLAAYKMDVGVHDDVETVIVPGNIGNKNLKWETTTQNSLGIDIGLLNNRFSLVVEAYDKMTRDLLLSVQLPTATGYATAVQNIGSIQNKGLEFTVNSVNLQGPFRWTTDFNISFNRSKVLKLGQSSRQLYGYPLANGMGNNILIKEGYPVGVFFGYIGDGVYNTQTEIDNSPVNNVVPKAGALLLGEMKFVDVNGDGVLNSFDQVPLAYTEPRFIAGLVNNFSYENFDLSVVLRGSYGNDIVNGNVGDLNELNLSNNTLQGNVTNMWRPKNALRDYVGVTKNGRRPYMHSEYVENGSFLRCDRISVGYGFSKKMLMNMRLSAFRVYFNVRNAFLITKYSWYDPEVSTGNALVLKLAPGVDAGAYPRTRQFQVGINLSL